jgi:hypothetical protein
VAIWYILWLFGIFFPVLVCFNKKNLATLLSGLDHFATERLSKVFENTAGTLGTYLQMYVPRYVGMYVPRYVGT